MACWSPPAHCPQHPGESQNTYSTLPGAPINAPFYCLYLLHPATDRHQRTFSTWWPSQGSFLFFLQTQTSGKVGLPTKKYLSMILNHLQLECLNSEALSHQFLGLALTTSYSLCLPWSLILTCLSDLSSYGTFSRKIFLTHSPQLWDQLQPLCCHGTLYCVALKRLNWLYTPPPRFCFMTTRIRSCCFTFFHQFSVLVII